MNETDKAILEQRLHNDLGPAPSADFETWSAVRADDIAHLNPVVTQLVMSRRRLLVRVASVTAIAASVGAIALLLVMPQRESFAQTAEAINKSTAITWKRIGYRREYSADGARSWLRIDRYDLAYLDPGHFRETMYDSDGSIWSVEIVDVEARKVLHLNYKKKKAIWRNWHEGVYGSANPFAWAANVLRHASLEYVGRQKMGAAICNVFRFNREARAGATIDFWIDTATKRLTKTREPGSDSFDPDHAADRHNNPEDRISKGELLGTDQEDIRFDANLDLSIFAMTIPEGFETIHEHPPAALSEENLLEWLKVTCLVNDGAFVDSSLGLDDGKHNGIAAKPKEERTELERKFLELWRRYVLKEHRSYPIANFADESTEPRSFRYIGKGVKLGDADRLVCWYRLKGSNQYRAVYGDLSIKNVDPKTLPLPVSD